MHFIYSKNSDIMSTEQSRRLTEQIRNYRCSRKGCLSEQRDPLEVVWFGQQYGECKEFTCSACYICSDEAVKASLPTALNVLPISLFVERFTSELKTYQQNKAGKEFFPKVMRERSKQQLAQLLRVETEVSERLNQLALALVGFGKKVEQANLRIFKHAVFEEIIQMNTEGRLDALLEKIVLLIEMLNVSSESYHFQDLQLRDKKLANLNQQIANISQRSLQVLKELYETIREKNELIAKL